MFRRDSFQNILNRILEPRRFIQVLAGSRQTGKTTLARQAMEAAGIPGHYATADVPTIKDCTWVEQQWEIGRGRCRSNGSPRDAVLVLDEIQKIPGWSEMAKALWDEDTAAGLPLRVIVLGSSPLLVQSGLVESLAGRFEILPVTHWSYREMREAFGWTIEQYIYFGGYPGPVSLAADPERWMQYILNALVETTVSRDVLLMSRVDKPALLRRVFEIGCRYSGQVLSFQKMLGQLQDAGNTVTLAHYLELLHGAGLLTGLSKYAGETVRRRSSSPKFLALNTALVSALSGLTFDEAREDREFWGRLVESAVGAWLANSAFGTRIEVFYWASRNHEVDFVLRRGKALVVIEVKSGRARRSLPGIAAFCREFQPTRKLLAGSGGIPLEEFLTTPIETWVA